MVMADLVSGVLVKIRRSRSPRCGDADERSLSKGCTAGTGGRAFIAQLKRK